MRLTCSCLNNSSESALEVVMCMHSLYRTNPIDVAGNFQGRKLSCKLVENTIFSEKSFTDCSFVPPKDTTLPNFMRKTFLNSHKTSKLAPP